MEDSTEADGFGDTFLNPISSLPTKVPFHVENLFSFKRVHTFELSKVPLKQIFLTRHVRSCK